MARSSTMNIAVFGDSFGVPKHTDTFSSWVTQLSSNCNLENFCQCGVGEYKILKQIRRADLHKFDQIIITHTSPTRVNVDFNPLHNFSQYHKDCDVIFADIENNTDEFSVACQMYFKYLFDLSYATDMHNLICEKIDQITSDYNVIHMTHFDYKGLYHFNNMLDFHDLFLTNRGTVTHYNKFGNDKIYNTLLTMLYC